MILVDTNIISELMRPYPDPKVLSWFSTSQGQSFFLSSVTIAEIEYSLKSLVESQKRDRLERAFHQAVHLAFDQRILPFCSDAAKFYGFIMAERKLSGKPLSVTDGQIAAIARLHELELATRNIKDFEQCGLDLINPFEAEE